MAAYSYPYIITLTNKRIGRPDIGSGKESYFSNQIISPKKIIMAATNQGAVCNITNNSGKDIILALAVNTDETTSSNAVVASNGRLELLTIAGGGTVLKNGSSGTVTLDRSYKPDAAGKGSVLAYDLQICDSSWLYPLASLPVAKQTSNGTSGFDPQTVTPDKEVAMSQAFAFYQTMAAFPNSQLTKDYIAAIQATKDAALAKADDSPGSAAAVADAISSVVNSFFKSTKDYQQVTLAEIVAVDNYYNNFPLVWAQYKDSLTYYVYGTNDTQATFEGTLSFRKSGPVDVTKTNGGYTCLFIPAVTPSDTSKTDVDNSKAVSLVYADGLFLDDPNTDKPKIALKGSFMLKGSFTDDPSDNSLLSVITGTVGAMTCIGFDVAQSGDIPVQNKLEATLGSSTIEQYWDTLIHPKNQHDLMISLLTLLGAVLLIPTTAGAIYGVYRIVKYKAQVKEALSKKIVEYNWQELNTAQRGALGLRLGKWCGPASNMFVEQNFNNMEGYEAVLRNNWRAERLLEALENQRFFLKTALQYKANFDEATSELVDSSLTSVKESMQALYTSKRTELGPLLEEQYGNFSEVQTNMVKIHKTIQQHLSEEAKESMEEDIVNGAEIFEAIQNSIKEETREKTESDPEVKDKLKPELEEI